MQKIKSEIMGFGFIENDWNRKYIRDCSNEITL